MNKQNFMKRPYFWPVGAGGMVVPDRVVAVGRYDSAPIRRVVRQARVEGKLIDLTFGSPNIWVLFLDTGHLVLASEPMPVASMDDFPEEFLWRDS